MRGMEEGRRGGGKEKKEGRREGGEERREETHEHTVG